MVDVPEVARGYVQESKVGIHCGGHWCFENIYEKINRGQHGIIEHNTVFDQRC